MPADFLLAPAATGKTAYAIARIHALRRTEPLAAIWVILPNNAQVVAFRRRLAVYLQPVLQSISDPARHETASTLAADPQLAVGSAQPTSGAVRQETAPGQSNQSGALGVRLGTFYALYAELLAEAGTLVACLDEPVLYRLLRVVAADLHARGELDFFAHVRDKPGFIRALHAAIQELKRARIEPAHFVAQVQGREARLGELARIYTGYQERLLASDWVDDEGRGWLAARALQRDPTLTRPWRLLVVDGFDEFNPPSLK